MSIRPARFARWLLALVLVLAVALTGNPGAGSTDELTGFIAPVEALEEPVITLPPAKLASAAPEKPFLAARILSDYLWADLIRSRLTEVGVVAYLYDAGFREDALVTMAATCWAESHGQVYKLGDTAPRYLVDGWVGSFSMCQIRAKIQESGTGNPRDPDILSDPFYNAYAAWEISSHGTNFYPWTMWKDGTYRQYMKSMEKVARSVYLMK